jgi:hypothetical protein
MDKYRIRKQPGHTIVQNPKFFHNAYGIAMAANPAK